jgi:Tfp pilus assembly protein PilX
MKNISRNLQSGAVSLFVVIFATLLITVVTVSFLRLMINDQNQASSNDLSQSAYDSALAGVEDAKRALLRYQAICSEDGPSICDQLGTAIGNANCNEALTEVIPAADIEQAGATASSGTGEVKIQQSESGSDLKLDQAYTCVKIKLLTDDYLGSLAASESKLIPLIGKNNDGTTDFDTVTLEWFTTDDIGKSSSGSYAVNLTGAASPQPLYATANWPANRPSVMRTQLMQYGSSFTLAGFDSVSSGQSNSNTIFMYPTSASAAPSESFAAVDSRRPSTGGDTPIDGATFSPRSAKCEATLASGGYACKTVFTLPAPIGGGDRTAFLRVGALYNQSHFRVTLSKNGTLTKFNGVQPEIDSTGRANTLFRRVASRVDLVDTSFPYPDGSVDVSGNLCKDFSVTNTSYNGLTTCTP